MLFKKLWRTMGLYKAQFISMVIMIALGVGMFVGFNMEWKSIEGDTMPFFEETGFADFRVVSQDGFSKDDAESVASIDGVQKAARFVSVNADVKERDGDSVALTVTEKENVSGVYLVSGEKYNLESENGVWLSDKYAAANDFSLGDKITLVYNGIEFSGTVKGLVKSGEHIICVRDESQLMPDYTTHGFAYISPKMYEKTLGMAFYPQINVVSDMTKKDFTEAADKKLKNTSLILSKDESGVYSSVHGEVEEGQTMGSILPVIFLLIAVLTMVTTMHRLAAKEKQQIGTLKALGFKDRRILVHYTSYAFMIGLIGSALGIGIGYGIAWFLMNPNGSMATYIDIPEWKLYFPGFCWAVLAVVLLALTVIGLFSVKKMLKGTAADALRPYTPKKVKPLLVEKTKWFHSLSFGTRWNLRDIMRHKSRTAMSLIGTLCCTMIILCAFGMRDTMNSFLSVYYDGATNYASRIYLSDSATDDDREKVAEKYNGDKSASVSVQIGEKAVSLDIYDVKNDKVRFVDENEDFIKLKNDGAYVCKRIAKEFSLSAGDTFTVSPYGSDKKYTLTVAGVMRSVSENIAITPDYAEKLDLPFSFDSVYTDTEKADIATDKNIKTVQSKQMIMDSFDTFIEIMNLMIYVLILGAVILGVVVLYNLGVMSYTERYREMATLKVVGFKDSKIAKLLVGQNLWVSVLGVVIGIPVGAALLDYLLTALASEYEMKLAITPLTYILSAVLTFGVSVPVSLMVAKKNKKIDMVEALKCAE